MARPAHDIAHLLLVEPLPPSHGTALSRATQAQPAASTTLSRKRKRGTSKSKSGKSLDVGSTPLAMLQRELDLLLVVRHREKNAHGSALWFRRLGQHITTVRRIVTTAQALLDGGTVAGACQASSLASDKTSAGTSRGLESGKDRAWLNVEKISYSAVGHTRELLLAVSHDADAVHWPGARPARYAPSLAATTTAGKKAQREALAVLSLHRTDLLARSQRWAEAYGTLLAAGRYVQLALVLLACLARCRAAVAGIDIDSGKIVGDDEQDGEVIDGDSSKAVAGIMTDLTHSQGLELADEDAFDLGQVIARGGDQPQIDSNVAAAAAAAVLMQTTTAHFTTRPVSDAKEVGTASTLDVEQGSDRETSHARHAKQKRAEGGRDRPTGRDKPAKKKKKRVVGGVSLPKDEIDDIFG